MINQSIDNKNYVFCNIAHILINFNKLINTETKTIKENICIGYYKMRESFLHICTIIIF